MNLFSSRETLTEQYGQEKMQQEMSNKSDFLLDKSDVSITDAMVERISDNVSPSFRVGDFPGTLNITLNRVPMDASRVEVTYSTSMNRESENSVTTSMQSFLIDADSAGTRDTSNGYETNIVIPSVCSRMHFWFTLYYDDGTAVVSRMHTAIMKQVLGDDYDGVMQQVSGNQSVFMLPGESDGTVELPSLNGE